MLVIIAVWYHPISFWFNQVLSFSVPYVPYFTCEFTNNSLQLLMQLLAFVAVFSQICKLYLLVIFYTCMWLFWSPWLCNSNSLWSKLSNTWNIFQVWSVSRVCVGALHYHLGVHLHSIFILLLFIFTTVLLLLFFVRSFDYQQHT